MRALIVDPDTIRATNAATLLRQHFCIPEVSEFPYDNFETDHHLKHTGPYALAMVADECLNAFKEVNTPTYPLAVSELNGVKPDVQEIFAGVAKAYGHDENHILRNGDIELDMTSRRGSVNERPIGGLYPKEYALLRQLLLANGMIASRDDLISAIYEYDQTVKPLALNGFASRLRTQIKKAGGDPQTIETVPKKGWIIRNNTQTQHPISEYGPIKIYADDAITYNEKQLKLGPNEFLILKLLVANPDHTVSMKEITNNLLPSVTGNENRKPATFISKLSKKIAAVSKSIHAPFGESIIENVFGEGYRLQDPKPIQPLTLTGITFRWPDLEVNTDTKTMTNLKTGQTQPLSTLQCKTLEFTFENPGWNSTGRYTSALQEIKVKMKKLGLAHENYISASMQGRTLSTGYRLTPCQIIDNTSTEDAAVAAETAAKPALIAI